MAGQALRERNSHPDALAVGVADGSHHIVKLCRKGCQLDGVRQRHSGSVEPRFRPGQPIRGLAPAAQPLRHQSGRPREDLLRNEAKLRQLALHDELTGLSNRNSLRESISKWVAEGQPFSLVFIDLDGFKAVNDNAGHERGDVELQRVGALLTAVLAPLAKSVGGAAMSSLPCCPIKISKK